MHTFPHFFVSSQPYVIVHSKPLTMQNFELHPEFYNKPVLLTEEEIKSPIAVIRQFFGDVPLIEVRIHLYNLLEVALTRSNTIYDEARERDAVLCFIKQLEKVIEIAWVINDINV